MTSLTVGSTGIGFILAVCICSFMSCCPLAPSIMTCATSAVFKNLSIQLSPPLIGRQSMASTNIFPVAVLAAMDIDTFSPSFPYLIPTQSFPSSFGTVLTLSAIHSASGIADLRSYWIHRPRRWILKSRLSPVISAAMSLSFRVIPRAGFVSYHASTSCGSC